MLTFFLSFSLTLQKVYYFWPVNKQLPPVSCTTFFVSPGVTLASSALSLCWNHYLQMWLATAHTLVFSLSRMYTLLIFKVKNSSCKSCVGEGSTKHFKLERDCAPSDIAVQSHSLSNLYLLLSFQRRKNILPFLPSFPKEHLHKRGWSLQRQIFIHLSCIHLSQVCIGILMAGKEVGVDQDQAGRNFHLILNLKYIYIYIYLFSRLLDFGLKSASQCHFFSPIKHL